MAMGPIDSKDLKKIAEVLKGGAVVAPFATSISNFASSSAAYMIPPRRNYFSPEFSEPQIDPGYAEEIERRVEAEVERRIAEVQAAKEREAVEKLARTPEILRKIKLEDK